MLCIQLENNDPYFCLAAEEYLLKHFTEDIFLLWQSENTVVVGKHQNAMAEINHPFVYRNNICIARRISGGGTVFHDAGNVNFAYILNVTGPSEISFTRFMRPVVEALGYLGIRAEMSGRNDLLVAGKKISGNAEHIFRNRVLHHGTLLFSSSLQTLGQSIRVTEGKYHDKAVQSKRSEVTNILPYLAGGGGIKDFISYLVDFHLQKSGSSSYQLTDNDRASISKLSEEKFRTWEWNYGYSPKYTFVNEIRLTGKSLKAELQVEKGLVTAAAVSGNFFSKSESGKLAESLIGEKHFYDEFRLRLREVHDTVQDDLVFAFF